MPEGALRYLSTEDLIDLFGEFQHLARIDPSVKLDHTRDYLLPVEELENLADGAEGKDLAAAAAYYVRNISIMGLFPDGNYRLALLAAELFLESNGSGLEYGVESALRLREQLMALKERHGVEGEVRPEDVAAIVEGPAHELCLKFVQRHLPARGIERFREKESGAPT